MGDPILEPSPSELVKVASTKWNAKSVEARIAKIEQLIHRRIQWRMILTHASEGELRECEVCGESEKGGYWCRPCIHKDWCCICCILLGIPNYETTLLVKT